MHIPAHLQLACVVVSTAASLIAQNTWPMFQADPAHTGYLPVSIKPASLKQRFKVRLSTSSLNPVTAADGRVFVTGRDKWLRILDASNGKQLHGVSFPGKFSVNPPSYANGLAYLQTGNHATDTFLRAYDVATGKLVFASPHAAQWEEYFAPTVYDAVVYVNGGYYGGMYAFDAKTGKQLWFRALPQYDSWTPALDRSYAYAYVGGWVYALVRATGVEAFKFRDLGWSWRGYDMNLAPMLGGKDDLFVINGGRLVRFDLRGRKTWWEVAASFTGQPAIKDGVVYGATSAGLQAHEQLTGRLVFKWTGTDGTPRDGNVIVTTDHAVVSSPARTWLVDLKTKATAWTAPEGGDISVSEGALYIAQSDGYLTSYGFGELPNPVAVEPSRTHYGEKPIQVVITGSAFKQGTNPQVLFGNTNATDVVVVDDNKITCTVPQLGPSMVDVTVQHSNGRKTLPDAFVYYPMQRITGVFNPAGYVEIMYALQKGSLVLGLIGPPPAKNIKMGIFHGALCIEPWFPLLMLPPWPFDRASLRIDLPNDPGLRVDVLFQALIADNLYGLKPGMHGAWTNCTTVQIR